MHQSPLYAMLPSINYLIHFQSLLILKIRPGAVNLYPSKSVLIQAYTFCPGSGQWLAHIPVSATTQVQDLLRWWNKPIAIACAGMILLPILNQAL